MNSITEAVEKVKLVGRNKVRILPVNNMDPIGGQQDIQILEGAWTTIFRAQDRKKYYSGQIMLNYSTF